VLETVESSFKIKKVLVGDNILQQAWPLVRLSTEWPELIFVSFFLDNISFLLSKVYLLCGKAY
jgi:hypothetical protein